jgi:hypothetical protein
MTAVAASCALRFGTVDQIVALSVCDERSCIDCPMDVFGPLETAGRSATKA